eukprot:3930618-Rhodomonas_salina.1
MACPICRRGNAHPALPARDDLHLTTPAACVRCVRCTVHRNNDPETTPQIVCQEQGGKQDVQPREGPPAPRRGRG